MLFPDQRRAKQSDFLNLSLPEVLAIASAATASPVSESMLNIAAVNRGDLGNIVAVPRNGLRQCALRLNEFGLQACFSRWHGHCFDCS